MRFKPTFLFIIMLAGCDRTSVVNDSGPLVTLVDSMLVLYDSHGAVAGGVELPVVRRRQVPPDGDEQITEIIRSQMRDYRLVRRG